MANASRPLDLEKEVRDIHFPSLCTFFAELAPAGATETIPKHLHQHV